MPDSGCLAKKTKPLKGNYGSEECEDPVGDVRKDAPSSVRNLDSRHNPAHRALSVLDVLLIIMYHVKEILQWDEIFMEKSYDVQDADRRRALRVARSFLALGSVNHLWRDAFHTFHSSWAVIPATLANSKYSLAGCIRLSGQSQLALSLSHMPDEGVIRVLATAASRLSSMRLYCSWLLEFHEVFQRPEVTDLVASLKTFEVFLAYWDSSILDWICASLPHLETLRLTNLGCTRRSYVFPSKLRALSLDYTWIHKDSYDSSSTLVAILALLPRLEILCVDIRSISEIPHAKVELVDMPNLKRLSVRTRSTKPFLTLVSDMISFPALEQAFLAVNVIRDVGHDLRAASSKLAQLVLKGSHPPPKLPNRIDIGHVYIDERGELNPKYGLGSWKTTLALAPRKDDIPFSELGHTTDCLASTAACLISVGRSLKCSPRALQSSTVDLILDGLPALDVTSVSIRCAPIALHASGVSSAGAVLPFDDLAFMTHFASARRLSWLGHDEQIATILETPEMLPGLNYLEMVDPCTVQGPERLMAAIEERKRQAQTSAIIPDNKGHRGRKVKNALLTSPLLPKAAENAEKMFYELQKACIM